MEDSATYQYDCMAAHQSPWTRTWAAAYIAIHRLCLSLCLKLQYAACVSI